MKTKLLLSLATGWLLMCSTLEAITIDMVTVGDAGNAADTTGYGAVDYVYQIGKTEVNLLQYTAFLNAVAATDTFGLYNPEMGTNANILGITRSGIAGSYTYSVVGSGERPVTFVSWFDAARFANWMANGQQTGAQVAGTTEDGAYTLNGATSGLGYTKNAINPNTGMSTTYWIPSENEWYKAAYYQPVAKGGPEGSYWLYPMQSNSVAGNTIGVANSANFLNGSTYAKAQNGLPTNLTDGGAYGINSASYYGTYDQGGGVWELTDALFSTGRLVRGGTWTGGPGNLLSTYRSNFVLSNAEFQGTGFRLAGVATIPEPSTVMLIILAGGAVLAGRMRKHSR